MPRPSPYKPASPQLNFTLAFLSSNPEATYAEAVEAAGAAGHRLTPITWAQARRTLHEAFGQGDGSDAAAHAAPEPPPARIPRIRGAPRPIEVSPAEVDVPAAAPLEIERIAEVDADAEEDVDVAADDTDAALVGAEAAETEIEPDFDDEEAAADVPPPAPRRAPVAEVGAVIPLDVRDRDDVAAWQRMIDVVESGGRIALEYVDGTWRLVALE